MFRIHVEFKTGRLLFRSLGLRPKGLARYSGFSLCLCLSLSPPLSLSFYTYIRVYIYLCIYIYLHTGWLFCSIA